jgi:hypothetical protein
MGVGTMADWVGTGFFCRSKNTRQINLMAGYHEAIHKSLVLTMASLDELLSPTTRGTFVSMRKSRIEGRVFFSKSHWRGLVGSP